MKEIDFAERRNAATASKKKLIEKMKLAPKADDPAVIASRAEKARISASKALERGERDRLKREADVRQKADDDARAIAEAIAARTELDAAAQRSLAEKAEQRLNGIAAMRHERLAIVEAAHLSWTPRRTIIS